MGLEGWEISCPMLNFNSVALGKLTLLKGCSADFQPVVSKGVVQCFSFLLVACTLELMKQCRKVRRKHFYFLLLSRIIESLDGNVVASVVRAGRCCPAPAPSRA